MRDALVRIRAGFLAAGALLCCAATAAAVPPQPKAPPLEIRVALLDGGEILLTDTAITCSKGGKTLWSREAFLPEMPLLFEDSKGAPLLLYFEADEELHRGLFFNSAAKKGEDPGSANTWGHAVFRALEPGTGKERWVHDFFSNDLMSKSPAGFNPVSPQYVRPWLYFARACWLDRMDPDTGIIVGRAMAWETIERLDPQPDGALRARLTLQGQPASWVLTYRGGRFLNPLHTGAGFAASQRLLRFASVLAPDFIGSARDSEFSGYLDTHRFKRTPPPPGFESKWAAYDLAVPEKTLREALRQDPLNPYLALYLAFCTRFMGRAQESEALFQEALAKSHLTWSEPFWMGRECEALGLVRWADSFYEAGTAAYFQEIEAPPESVTLIDVLIHFPAQRWSGILFANGHADRAVHLLELRRQLFPFTEGDAYFSRLYAAWLRDLGQETRALEEERRIEGALQRGGVSSFLDPWPWWFKGWLGWLAALLLLLLLTSFRAFGWRDFLLAIPVSLLLAQLPAMAKELLIGAAFLLGLAALFVFFGVRRDHGLALRAAGLEVPGMFRALRDRAFWAFAVRSPLTWLLVSFLAAAAAQGLVSRAGALACLWLACLPLLFLASRSAGRYLKRAGLLAQREGGGARWVQFSGTLVLAWLFCTFIAWQIGFIGVLASSPLVDHVGHPHWQELLLSGGAEEPAFDNRNGLFAAALSLHVGYEVGDPHREAARRLYERAAANSSPDARALNNLGALETDPARALGLYDRAVSADPACAAALYNLGVARGDRSLVERARALDSWRVEVTERYRPGRAMVATLSATELSKARMNTTPASLLLRCTNPYEIFGEASVFQLAWGLK